MCVRIYHGVAIRYSRDAGYWLPALRYAVEAMGYL